MITDKHIINLYNNCNKDFKKKQYMYKHVFNKDEIDYINSRFNDSKSFNESLDRILYNVEIRPICKYCGNEVEYVGKTNLMFRKYCCNKCKNNDANLVERNRTGCLRKYGVDNISKLPEIKERKRQTHLKNYGTLNNFGLESVKQTIFNKYGVDNISKLPEIKEKKKQTTLLHYNVETFLQHPIAREKRKTQESLNKEYETKRKNNSFNKSKVEDNVYQLLVNKFGIDNVKRHYKTKEYPYDSDFYIISKNMYIDYNGFPSHMNHPFNINDMNDINLLNKLKEKESLKIEMDKKNGIDRTYNQYSNYIYTWTDLDVRKRNIAKENNINRIEIWKNDNLNDIINSF
ncbi:MAG: hypothetical protein IJH39_08230 [Clostridia bacterium]|nr:hypothetical protein [Clostridia bacterium]